MRLAEPGWLILLVFLPLPWLWARARPRVTWPTLKAFAKAPKAAAGWLGSSSPRGSWTS